MVFRRHPSCVGRASVQPSRIVGNRGIECSVRRAHTNSSFSVSQLEPRVSDIHQILFSPLGGGVIYSVGGLLLDFYISRRAVPHQSVPPSPCNGG